MLQTFPGGGLGGQAEEWETTTSGRSKSSWFADATTLAYRPLDSDTSVDIAIVGGGIAGMTTAYFLSRIGKKIAVIDDGNAGSGETSRTTAHITHALDDRYYNIEKFLGKKGAALAAESHTAAIDMVEKIVGEEQIDCGFERLDGFLFLDPTDTERSLLRELEATHRVGISNTEIVPRAPIRSFDTGPCIRFPMQAQFQPLKYLAGLGRALVRSGGQVYTGTHVQSVTANGVRTSDGHKVRAKNVVVATNAPIIDKTNKIYERQDAYRTYVIAARIRKGTVPKALYWDTGIQSSKNPVIPYHYVRIQELDLDHDLLLIGGEDHEAGSFDNAKERYERLESWTRQRFPIQEIEYRWSGQVLEPKDAIALIGLNPRDKRRNIYIATGDSGNGMTHGTIAGIILKDLIAGTANRWTGLYDPSRRMRGRIKRSGKEPKKLTMTDALKRAQNLSEGQGEVLEIQRKKPHAFYKDLDGVVHRMSAVCTHLGCTVNWNASESSYDCPCHGSRFSYGGKVINGPANDDLEKL